MIDFSIYSVNEQQAINDVLYDLQKYLYDNEMEWDYLHNAFFCSTMQLRKDIDLQAEQAEAEKVDRIKKACVAGAPPAEEPDDLQALVDTLSRCSDRLAALAHEEDEHFAESSQMNDFLKASSLRNANRSIIDLLADIRDHYDGLH